MDRQPRPGTIFGLEVLEQTGEHDFLLRIGCSKGTYIRTLCHDIGAALGCGGIMATLRRTKAAGFDLSQAVTMEQILEHETPAELLLPVDTYFAGYPALTIRGEAERRCRNGNDFSCPGEDGTFRVYGVGGEFLMLGERRNGKMTTIKSFFAPQTK